MRHKKILEVFTVIYEQKQKIGFILEGLEKKIYLSAISVEQNTKVKVREVEILTGSTMRVEFYQKGDKMFRGEINDGESLIVKNFWIECKGSVSKMRENNSSLLKNFKEIKSVFIFNKNDKDIIGFDIGEEKAVFTSANYVTAITSLSLGEIHILEGSYILPKFYQEGENIYEAKDRAPMYCWKSETLLKKLNLRLLGTLEEMHDRFENSESSLSVNHHDSRDDYTDSYDSNNWLSDAAGSDDPDVMSDAYWNLD